MPQIDLSILNQRQTPAFYADVFANRPAAGFIGRIFVSTNTFAFYRDNGTSWDLIGGPGTGTVTGTGANGQVTFWNGASTITGSNDLFWDATNGHLGVNTNAPGTALDVHHDQPTVAILNQTVATNDVRIGFQNNGVGLWRIGNFYNAGENDFGIYDAIGAVQPFTIKKNTQQVLIGGGSGGSGKLVVTSGASDNGVQIVGANAPSLRIDDLSIGATKRVGLGISTAINNFIQGSVNGDFCIFSGTTSTPASMLFGIYDSGLTNVQEAARISFTRNFLIGSTTDNGAKLQVNGTSVFTDNVGIGTTAITTSTFRILKNLTNTISTAFSVGGQIQSTGIGQNNYINTSSTTAAGVFNVASIRHINIQQGTFGAGSTVSDQFGVFVGANMIGASSNFGFFGDIPSGTNRWNLYMSGTANNYMAGSLYIGTTISNSSNVRVSQSITGATTWYGIRNDGRVQSDVTTKVENFTSFSSTVASAFTLGTYSHYTSNQGTFGAGSSITNQIGYEVQSSLTGATNNFGFYGNIPSGTNRWNLYMNGTAANYLNGTLLIGTTSVGGSKLRIVGLPTSAAGLSSGDIYSNAGILTIVP